MAKHKSIPVHFMTSDGQPRADRVIHALWALCRTLDQADITSAEGVEAERIAYLISAASILSAQLTDRIDDLAVSLEVVNG